MMKLLKSFLIIAILIGMSPKVVANVEAYFDYKTFYVPGQGAFLELYFDFSGTSINYIKTTDGKLQGEVEITSILKKGDEIITFDKKILKSPLVNDSSIVDFIDQHRMSIPPGDYTIEIILRDVNAKPDEEPSQLEQQITVSAPENEVFLSDIQMISAYKKAEAPGAYTKSGYDLIPFVSDYINPNMNEIVLYAEVYNTTEILGEGEKFAVFLYIEDAETLVKLPEFAKVLRKEAASVVPFIQTVNFETVHSGSYNFVLEVRSKDNSLLARQKVDFVRNNPRGISSEKDIIDPDKVNNTFAANYKDRDELMENIHSLRPISKDKELFIVDNTINHQTELTTLQGFFYSFWQVRHPEDPEKAWAEYRTEVIKAEGLFGTKNKRGYETDRGRIFLLYGAPDDIVDRPNEQSSYPYQIWRYYRANNWNNVKFVFYDPMLTMRDYELLNVDYIPGEVRNPRWKIILQSRNTPMNNIDRKEGIQQYGGQIDELYENPR